MLVYYKFRYLILCKLCNLYIHYFCFATFVTIKKTFFCDILYRLVFTIAQRRIFIFSFGGVDKYLGGDAACFGRGAVATPGKAKENV